MKRLSIPWSDWDVKGKKRAKGKKLQAVVVGSGYGGSVAALRLAQQGWRVTVLERGGEFLPGQFPNDFSHLPPFLRLPSRDGRAVLGNPSGVLEMRAGPGVAALVGNGVGGGSLINAGVLMRPEQEVFAQAAWPSAIRHAGESLDKWFEKAKRKLKSENTVHISTVKSRAFDTLATKLGDIPDSSNRRSKSVRSKPVDVTIDLERCTRCGDCATGCNVEGAKQTLRDTYLRKACKTNRVTVVSGVTVYSIEPVNATKSPGDPPDAKTSWQIRIVPTGKIANYRTIGEAATPREDKGAGIDIEADLVVLSAGTFGTVEILQRSVASSGNSLPISTALGARFSGNGDAWSVSANEADRVNAIGIGADRWRVSAGENCQDDGSEDLGVGPTITRVIDLRDSEQPLRRRILIEDGAMPGSLGNAYAALLTTCFTAMQLGQKGWQKSGHEDPLSSGRILGKDPASLAERTQLLLTMGHDESKGRILWLRDRNASVPYFEDPEKLETYRYQEQVLRSACDNNRSLWLPTPTWQRLPKAMTGLLSGPDLDQAMLMTVHPLGGCVMGDDPESSVVDPCGRVRIAGSHDVYESLYVLDGSIVPTSLGCNPLWTITALAERALHDEAALHCRQSIRTRNTTRGAVRPPIAADPAAPKRDEAPVLPVYLEERLVCSSLNLPEPLAERIGHGSADLEFTLHTKDWMAMWDSENHELQVQGRLRIDQGEGKAPIVYGVDKENARARLLVADRDRNFIVRCLQFLRVIVTYLVYRGPELRGNENIRRMNLSELYRYLITLKRYFWQATEVRRMDYEVELEPASAIDGIPARLYLRGAKRIEYAATCAELLRYFERPQRKRKIRPRLRDTFLDQASNLRVSFWDEEHRFEWPHTPSSVFYIDFAPMIEKLPVRLKSAGDLPNALTAIAEYPLLMIRYLLKTRAFDFRAPDYSGIPVPDVAAREEIRLKLKDRTTVRPEEIPLRVLLGRSSSDAPGTPVGQEIDLTLWRYRRRGDKPEFRIARWEGKDVIKARSVLLVHAFGQSGYSFTLDSIRNPATCLYEAGFEVWILEHRLSTRLAAHEKQTTIDQIARYDIPKAVDKILEELDKDRDDWPGHPIQIFAFAQCLGAAATSMALLSGKLSHENHTAPVGSGLPPLEMPKLAGLFISQTHPHCIGQPVTQAKSWLPAALRDTFAIRSIPFAVRNGEPNLLESLADRLFATLPLPEKEECPVHRDSNGKPSDEDATATCRRIRFLEAPLFKHANLNDKTHADIARWFGDANVRTFAQAAKFVEAERLVTEDGDNAYVTDLAFHRYAALPICYLHGAENELFHPEGAIRSAKHYARLQPDWADRVAETVRKVGRWREEHRAARIIKDYGHVDLLVGKNSATDIFEPIATALDKWFALKELLQPDATARSSASRKPMDDTTSSYARAHLPVTGPLIGAVEKGKVAISFRLDDRFSDGKSDELGSRTWAFARYPQGKTRQIQPLEIHPVKSPFGSQTGPEGDTVAYRVAAGELPITSLAENLEIECFSVHEVIVPGNSDCPRVALKLPSRHFVIDKNSNKEIFRPDNDWIDELLGRTRNLLKSFEHDAGPARRTVSRLRHYPESYASRLATLKARSFKALAQDRPSRAVTFGAASCRYPGFRIEHRRVDRWLRLAGDRMDSLDFGFLLGDQIYADATGGFADPLNPTERFNRRYRFAFARSRASGNDLFADRREWFGDWLTGLPIIMTPDDHEFHDAFPDGPPIVKAPPRDMSSGKQMPWQTAARKALFSHQQLQLEPYREQKRQDVWTFTAGAARIIVIDTRSHRPKRSSGEPIISDETLGALDDWLKEPEANHRLSIIATGSVLLPGKISDSSPANPGREDNFQIDPDTRRAIFTSLLEAREKNERFRFLLLSGDYHLSAQAVVREEYHPATYDKARGDRNRNPGGVKDMLVGACIVAPPLYSPMPFADSRPATLWRDEELCFVKKPGDRSWLLDDCRVQKGSGLGVVTVAPTREGYHIEVRGETWEPFAHHPEAERHIVKWERTLPLPQPRRDTTLTTAVSPHDMDASVT